MITLWYVMNFLMNLWILDTPRQLMGMSYRSEYTCLIWGHPLHYLLIILVCQIYSVQGQLTFLQEFPRLHSIQIDDDLDYLFLFLFGIKYHLQCGWTGLDSRLPKYHESLCLFVTKKMPNNTVTSPVWLCSLLWLTAKIYLIIPIS